MIKDESLQTSVDRDENNNLMILLHGKLFEQSSGPYPLLRLRIGRPTMGIAPVGNRPMMEISSHTSNMLRDW